MTSTDYTDYTDWTDWEWLGNGDGGAMNIHWTERLSDYRDGELTADERRDCETHLALCAECREALEDIETVIGMAREAGETLPATNLWPGILARIAPGSGEAESRDQEWRQASARRRPRQITFTLPQLALAASLLIAVSAAVSYVAAGRTTGTPPLAYETPILAVAELAAAPAVQVTPANFADAQFDQAVADLERTLVEQRDQLDPRTIIVIERNLRAIDEAIRQAREALDGDPSNTFLNSHLAEARKRKIELLRRATSIAGN